MSFVVFEKSALIFVLKRRSRGLTMFFNFATIIVVTLEGQYCLNNLPLLTAFSWYCLSLSQSLFSKVKHPLPLLL
eukprot:TRINITY_DN3321_c4_g1_i1.p2 TRINITY_DN3321_c4_g1~~TRINITY_DN3321_c4_g1_i1.p2  ORF type:complete len:75 (-),score=4.17 TRINITY_DN3321_c4_g1_i1:201-425(-)